MRRDDGGNFYCNNFRCVFLSCHFSIPIFMAIVLSWLEQMILKPTHLLSRIEST